MSCWEDTEVLHEDCGFREKHGSVVQRNRDPERLDFVNRLLRLRLLI